MRELDVIVREVQKLRSNGKTAVLATVVDVSGSAYRLPGARMLVSDNAWAAGSISGGCLESDIILRAPEVIKKGEATLVTYDTTSDEDIVFGVGLGCRGIIRVLIEPITPEIAPADLIEFIRTCLTLRQIGIVATVVRAAGHTLTAMGSRLLLHPDGTISTDISDSRLVTTIESRARQARAARNANTTILRLPDDEGEVFLETVRLPTPLVVFGAGHDAIPVVRFAKEIGWHVTVIDHRPAYATKERFPQADEVIMSGPSEIPSSLSLTSDTAALIMTHNFLRDLNLLKALLPSPVRYLGLLGPRRRADELLEELKNQGIGTTPAQLERLFAPVGLDIGVETPEGVALSILSEVQAVIAERGSGHLRDRKSSIHGLEPRAPRVDSVQSQQIDQRFAAENED